MDIHIFSLIKKRFENSKKLFFEHDPVKNLDLLKSLDKKTILISHHGSAILEGAYKNFKNISSKATVLGRKIKNIKSMENKKRL